MDSVIYNVLTFFKADKLRLNKNKKTLRYSFLDGLFASGMLGFTQDYLTPFMLFLGGTARHVGFLSALPNLFASIAQLKSPDFVHSMRSRKKIINSFVFLQALTLLVLTSLVITSKVTPLPFILLVSLFAAFGALAYPAWGSLMADLISSEKRGRYFGWRNQVLGIITVAFSFIAGFVLHLAKPIELLWGFAAIFGLAFIFRMLSLHFLRRMYEPPLDHDGDDGGSILDFIYRLRENNFGRFVLFVALMNFSVMLSGPFFPVLMLRDLHFGYMLYTIVTVTATLTIYLSIKRWGEHADRVGNLKVMMLTSRFIVFVPVFWVFYREPWFLMLAQVFSGFFWAGFTIACFNFINDCTTPEQRTRSIAYYTALTGVGTCLGALAGGYLLNFLPAIFGYKILSLFILSSALRLLVAFVLPFKLTEVRRVDEVDDNQLVFSVIGVKSLTGMDRKHGL